MFLYSYLKEWRRNPHWSFSCCLALVLPFDDLQGEINGLTGANVLDNQLQSGQIDKPSVLSALKDSGAIDVTLEGEQSGDGSKEMEKESCPLAEHSNIRCHQGIQTELLSLSVRHRGIKVSKGAT